MEVVWGDFNQKEFLINLGFKETEQLTIYKHEASPIPFLINPDLNKKDTIQEVFTILIKIGKHIKTEEIKNILFNGN